VEVAVPARSLQQSGTDDRAGKEIVGRLVFFVAATTTLRTRHFHGERGGRNEAWLAGVYFAKNVQSAGRTLTHVGARGVAGGTP
jgi:hypothetical protein